jgi:hypothetical protein
MTGREFRAGSRGAGAWATLDSARVRRVAHLPNQLLSILYC